MNLNKIQTMALVLLARLILNGPIEIENFVNIP